MTKKGVIRCLLSLLIAVYLGFALVMANQAYQREQCQGFDIRIVQPEGSRNFVTRGEIMRLLHLWKLDNTSGPATAVNLQAIEDKLRAEINIEDAEAQLLPDGHIRLTVTPMIPVARVFDYSGHSYYINREGKRLTANARYHLDVPIITGTFDKKHSPADILPVLNYIRRDSAWNAITAQLMVESDTRDIILVPLIRGHVINLGDTTDIPGKLRRVMAMYHKVMPLKGWMYYDTISVKWGGQVVATRRVKSIPEPLIRFDQEGDVEEEDINSMLTDTGPALPSDSPAPSDSASRPTP